VNEGKGKASKRMWLRWLAVLVLATICGGLMGVASVVLFFRWTRLDPGIGGGLMVLAAGVVGALVTPAIVFGMTKYKK
jgi:hypothetical protein